ncbi:MAG: hypothetical protein HN392_07910 [Anaerolineae bacterium]|jgi:hypothetical protein|nr:hypothetical protein [Anaerolineae bacterium]MBT7073474.1 hypothetical protein [Anaerolineae bacterium]MBT7782318.1 hypothetical protein [Anaerolineae bacterium]
MSLKINPWRLLLKAGILFAAFNFAFTMLPTSSGNSVSLYNNLVPGRERLPFGENPTDAYNLSLFDIDAMFASHIISDGLKSENEYRVVIVGDSSVWGTLLRPEETLSGQLNALNLTNADGKNIQTYNLGYPTISLTKDLLVLEKAMEYKPDLVIWMLTLESLPADKQLTAPLVSHNPVRVRRLLADYELKLEFNSDALTHPTFWDTTLIGRRRSLADWSRLQFYGVMWGITGIDQLYPETYEPAKIDFEEDNLFHDWAPSELPLEELAFPVIGAAYSIAGNVPLILVNEPILISDGVYSDIRYNYFYPRWAYDQYRNVFSDMSLENDWVYYDYWDIIPVDEFTNSAVHLSVAGEEILADIISEMILFEAAR